MVESKPPKMADDAIASVIQILESQLHDLDSFGLTIAAAHLDASIQQLRADRVVLRDQTG